MAQALSALSVRVNVSITGLGAVVDELLDDELVLLVGVVRVTWVLLVVVCELLVVAWVVGVVAVVVVVALVAVVGAVLAVVARVVEVVLARVVEVTVDSVVGVVEDSEVVLAEVAAVPSVVLAADVGSETVGAAGGNVVTASAAVRSPSPRVKSNTAPTTTRSTAAAIPARA